MILKTDFRRSGAGNLVQYMRRDNEKAVELRDKAGRALSQEEVEQFVDKSAAYGFQRHIILSPDPAADYSGRELDRHTRATMREWRADRPSANYLYAVHREVENPHAHVAATGKERDLRMDKADITQLRERAREVFRERERVPQRERHPERESQRETDWNTGTTLGESHSHRGHDPVPERESASPGDEAVPEREPDFEPGGEG